MTKRVHERGRMLSLRLILAVLSLGYVLRDSRPSATISDTKRNIRRVGARKGHATPPTFAMQCRHIFMEFVFLI